MKTKFAKKSIIVFIFQTILALTHSLLTLYLIIRNVSLIYAVILVEIMICLSAVYLGYCIFYFVRQIIRKINISKAYLFSSVFIIFSPIIFDALFSFILISTMALLRSK
jgi:hypothetical protein